MSDEEVVLRVVTDDDCYDLWVWRNHDQVRRWCFKSAPIAYEDHQSWFTKKVSDNTVDMYVACLKTGEKVGQIRFEQETTEKASVHVNLNPEFFGRGLGNKMIRMGTAFFFEKHIWSCTVEAEIIQKNIVSIKSFQKAGYIFSRSEQRHGQAVDVYICARESGV